MCALICPLCSNWMVGEWVRINLNVVRILKSAQNNGRSLSLLTFQNVHSNKKIKRYWLRSEEDNVLGSVRPSVCVCVRKGWSLPVLGFCLSLGARVSQVRFFWWAKKLEISIILDFGLQTICLSVISGLVQIITRMLSIGFYFIVLFEANISRMESLDPFRVQ